MTGTFSSIPIDRISQGYRKANRLDSSEGDRFEEIRRELRGGGIRRDAPSEVNDYGLHDLFFACVRKGYPAAIAMSAVMVIATSAGADNTKIAGQSPGSGVSSVAGNLGVNAIPLVTESYSWKRTDDLLSYYYDKSLREFYGLEKNEGSVRLDGVYTFINGTYVVNPYDRENWWYYHHLLEEATYLNSTTDSEDFFSSISMYMAEHYPTVKGDTVPLPSVGSRVDVMGVLVEGNGTCAPSSLALWWTLRNLGYKVELGTYNFQYSIIEDGREVIGTLNHVTPVVIHGGRVFVLDGTIGFSGSRDDYMRLLYDRFPTMTGAITTAFHKPIAE